MKRFLVAVLVIVFVLSLTASAAAAPPGLEMAKAKWEDGKPGEGKALGLMVDGKAQPWGDVPPVIKEGRVLIPIRGMMAALGAQVDWDADNRTVTITVYNTVYTDVLEIDFKNLDDQGLPTFTLNGEDIDGPDVPPMNINGRIVLPLRFIAETLGLDVFYDAENKEVQIANQNKPEWAGKGKPPADVTITDNDQSEVRGAGFWKNSTGAWVYGTTDTLDDVFDPDLLAEIGVDGNTTLLAALSFSGGPDLADMARLLLRQAVAAVLNAVNPDIDYPLSLDDVIGEVNEALKSKDRDTIEVLKDLLDGYNNP